MLVFMLGIWHSLTFCKMSKYFISQSNQIKTPFSVTWETGSLPHTAKATDHGVELFQWSLHLFVSASLFLWSQIPTKKCCTKFFPNLSENRRLDCPTAKSVPLSLVAPWLVALTMPIVSKVAERQAGGRLQAHWMHAGRAQTPEKGPVRRKLGRQCVM